MSKPKKKDSLLNTPPPSGYGDAPPEEEEKIKERNRAAKERQAETFRRDGMKIRTYVLHVALWMEERISDLIGEFLEINVKESHVIGYRSNPISFNQKVWLLIDMGTVKGEDFKDFQTFMEIRNMLMHNLSARSLVECFAMFSEKDGNDAKTNKLVKLADEKIAKLPNVMDEWTPEARLDLGLRVFVDQVAAKTKDAVDILGARTLAKTDQLASVALRKKFRSVVHKPAEKVIAKINASIHLSYPRAKVIEMITSISDEIGDLHRDMFRAEVLEQINVVRQRAGMDPITELPTPQDETGSPASG